MKNKIRSIDLFAGCGGIMDGFEPVSYTHLDVYKRQSYKRFDNLYSGLQKERKCLRFDRTCTGACGKTSETAGAAPGGARPKEKQYGMQSKHGCVQSP